MFLLRKDDESMHIVPSEDLNLSSHVSSSIINHSEDWTLALEDEVSRVPVKRL
jgi:hypothetical protein